MEDSFRFFPLWKRGMKGDFTAFQKAKLLRIFYLMSIRFFSAISAPLAKQAGEKPWYRCAQHLIRSHDKNYLPIL